ncbi:MAG TPA: DoxX family protein [Thermoanaerobaculia bacterium]|nr:DoxX family protein [Thermoanaerobaculia bacterium]
MRRYAILAIRLFLGITFLTSGLGKLTHGDFPGFIGPVWLEERLAQYGLGLWARFVAWSQVGVGLLLLSQRFSTLGALMLVPMLANILVITISLQWRGTPYVNAVLLAMNLVLLAADARKLRPLFTERTSDVPLTPLTIAPRADALALAGVAAGVLAPLLHDVHRVLTFGLVGIALALFVASAVVRRR